jgi:hypothetical protein
MVEFDDLEVISPDDAWVAGNRYDAATQRWEPGLWHWDGRAWVERPIDLAAKGAPDRLVAVSAWDPDDVWIAGTTSIGDRGARAVALHWDGATWTTRATQGRRAAPIDTFGLVAVASDDALLTVRNGVVRWDGGGWTDSGFEARSPTDVPLEMERGSDGGVWAKVWNTDVARWDGATWRSGSLGRLYAYGMSVVDGAAVFTGATIGTVDLPGKSAMQAYDC